MCVCCVRASARHTFLSGNSSYVALSCCCTWREAQSDTKHERGGASVDQPCAEWTGVLAGQRWWGERVRGGKPYSTAVSSSLWARTKREGRWAGEGGKYMATVEASRSQQGLLLLPLARRRSHTLVAAPYERCIPSADSPHGGLRLRIKRREEGRGQAREETHEWVHIGRCVSDCGGQPAVWWNGGLPPHNPRLNTHRGTYRQEPLIVYARRGSAKAVF